jgi:hypothetical protein
MSVDRTAPDFRCVIPRHTKEFMSSLQHIVIEDDGRILAEAVVKSHPDLVEAMLRVEAGHIAPGTSSRLVDAVIDLMQVPPGTALEMTFPTGQAEILEQIRRRCPSLTTRVAGVSCRLHTTVPPPTPPVPGPPLTF